MEYDFRYGNHSSKIKKLAKDFDIFFDFVNSLRRLPAYKDDVRFQEILKQSKRFTKYEKMFSGDGLFAARPCRVCGQETIVYDSRLGSRGEIVRRRKCLHCGARHRTVELYDGEID